MPRYAKKYETIRVDAWYGVYGMVRKYGELNICISDASGSAVLNEGKREISCEVYAFADVEHKNCLDKFEFVVGAKNFADAIAVVYPYIFEYVKKRYAELLAAAQTPLDNVLDDAAQRAGEGWTFGDDSLDGCEWNSKKSLIDELGL